MSRNISRSVNESSASQCFCRPGGKAYLQSQGLKAYSAKLSYISPSLERRSCGRTLCSVARFIRITIKSGSRKTTQQSQPKGQQIRLPTCPNRLLNLPRLSLCPIPTNLRSLRPQETQHQCRYCEIDILVLRSVDAEY